MKVNHLKRAGALTASVILLNCGQANHAADCLKWVKRTDVGSYGQRMHHAMVYDPDLKLTIFFGGEIGSEDDREYFDDTQSYDGKHWIPINFFDNVRPSTRSMHAMAYDYERHQIVLYGGHRADGPAFGDTWILITDGLNGKWIKSDKGVGTIAGQAMVWDPVRKVVMMQGGVDRVFPPAFDKIDYFGGYTWDGQTWHRDSTAPSGGAYGLAMAFDTNRGVALAYGGFAGRNEAFIAGFSFFHEYTPGGTWVPLRGGASIRAYAAMAYDERRQRVVMVGGVGNSPSVGEEAYEYLPDKGWVPIPRLPEGQGRAGAKMVYDSARGVMVLTGGAGGGAENADDGGRYSDTWELVPTLSITKQPASTTNEVCADAQFSVEAEGVAPFKYTWRRDGSPLVDDNQHYFGAAGPVLTIKGLRHDHAGNYDVIVEDSCGGGTGVNSQAATLTVTPPSRWVFRGTNGPPVRFGHGMAYDSRREVMVLFGGQTNWNGTFPFNDLWEWDGAFWRLRMANDPTSGWTNVPKKGWMPSYRDRPVQRADFAMAYDSNKGKVVIFGGRTLSPGGNDIFLRDLWEWDGTGWNFRATNGPNARIDCSMAYDESRGQTVLFGGTLLQAPGDPTELPGLVWEWNGDQWQTNAPIEGVGPENFFAKASSMSYDRVRNRVLIGPTAPVGRSSAWVFWDWDGGNWRQINRLDYSNDPVLSMLQGTSYGALAFDEQLRRSVWFGGAQNRPINRTALFDGNEWTLLTDSPANPAPRLRHAMAYDSRRRVTVLFGGSLVTAGATGATNDTWELASFDAPLINEHPASQYRKVGDTATFTVKAVSPGALAYQWFHAGINSSDAVAEKSDTLTIPKVGPRDEGEYYVLVSSSCGATSSRTAILTLDPKLQVFSSGNSTTLVWAPEPKLVLEVAPTVNGLWTIVPNPPIPFNISTLGPGKFFRLRRLP